MFTIKIISDTPLWRWCQIRTNIREDREIKVRRKRFLNCEIHNCRAVGSTKAEEPKAKGSRPSLPGLCFSPGSEKNGSKSRNKLSAKS